MDILRINNHARCKTNQKDLYKVKYGRLAFADSNLRQIKYEVR